MYRARTVLNNLVPFIPSAAGPERFASWLLGSRKICVSSFRQYNAPVASEPFLNGSSGAYVEEMYNAWLSDPKSVHASWDSFFRNSSAGAMPGQAYTAPPSLAEPARNTVPFSSVVPMFGGMGMPGLGGQVNEKVIDDHLAVQAIIRSYQSRGHLVAEVDPLGITYADLHSKFTDRKGTPHEVVVRQYMLDSRTSYRQAGPFGYLQCRSR